MNNEIKETITKGQAMDIADTQKFNEDVKAVRIDGDTQNNVRSAWEENDAVTHNPKKQVDFDEKLDFVELSIDGIYSYKEDSFKQGFYVTDQRHGLGISVNGYARVTREERSRGTQDGGFSIYFDNKEQVISFANKCLDMLLIAEERKALDERYKGNWNDGKHPDIYKHFPSMIEKIKCETGRYYWDASLNKAVEITEDTDQNIIDSQYYRDCDDDGNFEPDWKNEEAEEKLLGLEAGIKSNWDEEHYQGINLAEIQTGVGDGYRREGISQHKGKDPNDKRRNQWTTKFYMTDGTVETLVGYWEMTSAGTITRREYKEN
tara:strand:- start:53 stop:1009 length:957 start_codon:yes stop_codon:yes gene_type:complete